MADTITLTIDGKTCQGVKGQTILEVAKAGGVDIPTLCHHPWLPNHGACRMCVVEVEGNRRLVTACAAPAEDGMVVTVTNDNLRMLRQMTLELLFAERNHICPYCPMTGVCELQDKAYEHGITHTRYDYLFPVLTPDTSNPYFVQDHNRCILCGRCVRACYEIAGTGTLGFGHRGSREVIIADLGVPLGDSSCINCGTCVDVCPTGALFDKRAPYFSRGKGYERKPAICPDDDLGCVMNVVVKSGLVARIEAKADAPVNGPLLSQRARYDLLNEPYPRLLGPKRRDEQGKLVDCSWDEALALAGEALSEAGADGLAGLASARLPRETLEAFHGFITETCGSVNVDTFEGPQRQTRRAANDIYGEHVECGLEALDDADMILLVGFDPCRTHLVLGAWLARKRHHEQTPIVSLNAKSHVTSSKLCNLVIKPRRGGELAVLYGLLGQLVDRPRLAGRVDREIAEKWRSHPPTRVAHEAGVEAEAVVEAARLYAEAKKPLILYGPDLTEAGNPTLIGRLWEIARLAGQTTADGALRVRGFTTAANSAAAEAIGYRGADLAGARVVYMLAGDDPHEPSPQLAEELREAPRVILQASHESPLCDFAQLVLPSLKWSERGGTWINVTGLEQRFEACTTPPAGLKSDEEILAAVAAGLGEPAQEATHE